MIKYFLPLSIVIILSCNQSSSQQNTEVKAFPVEQPRLIIEKESTVKTRFLPPKGYKWVNTDPESFGYFLENFNLKPYKSPILKYDGTAIATQNLHEAVFNIDVGEKDLQQCADAIIRLKAEYHYQRKEDDKIKFTLPVEIALVGTITNPELELWLMATM